MAKKKYTINFTENTLIEKLQNPKVVEAFSALSQGQNNPIFYTWVKENCTDDQFKDLFETVERTLENAKTAWEGSIYNVTNECICSTDYDALYNHINHLSEKKKESFLVTAWVIFDVIDEIIEKQCPHLTSANGSWVERTQQPQQSAIKRCITLLEQNNLKGILFRARKVTGKEFDETPLDSESRLSDRFIHLLTEKYIKFSKENNTKKKEDCLKILEAILKRGANPYVLNNNAESAREVFKREIPNQESRFLNHLSESSNHYTNLLEPSSLEDFKKAIDYFDRECLPKLTFTFRNYRGEETTGTLLHVLVDQYVQMNKAGSYNQRASKDMYDKIEYTISQKKVDFTVTDSNGKRPSQALAAAKEELEINTTKHTFAQAFIIAENRLQLQQSPGQSMERR